MKRTYKIEIETNDINKVITQLKELQSSADFFDLENGESLLWEDVYLTLEEES